MEVNVKRKEINLENYGWYIQEYVFKFLKDNHMLNNENKNKLKNIKIYAENLIEQNCGRMVSRPVKNPPEIAIDFKFFDLKTMTIKEQNQKVVFSQIIHEMLHQISSYNDKEGKIVTGIVREGSTNNKYRIMNEGFTQMITERITGFVLSPDNDRYYTYFKNIAKIIADTIGDQTVYESYFNHNHSIDNVLNSIAKDDNFFESLMAQMSILNCNTIDERIRNEVKDLITKKVCSSIIVPKVKSLQNKDKIREYLAKLQNDLKNDEGFLGQVKHCTKEYTQLDNRQLTDKRMKIEKQLNDNNIKVYANTLNFVCSDIGKDNDYLIQQMLPAISFDNNTCQIKVNREMKYKYGKDVYTYTKNEIKCLINDREKFRDNLYGELYINNYLSPKLRK